MEFQGFGKIPRLHRECVITEKLDGTNAQVLIFDQMQIKNGEPILEPPEGEHWLNVGEGLHIAAGSRNRYITPDNDNFGLARWVWDNAHKLVYLGHGRHFGEWWGRGIQRGYGLDEKRFSLFNTGRWNDDIYHLTGCHVVPVLFRGTFNTQRVGDALRKLEKHGSVAAPGYMRPEGVIVYHTAAGTFFKKTLENDNIPKTLQKGRRAGGHV